MAQRGSAGPYSSLATEVHRCVGFYIDPSQISALSRSWSVWECAPGLTCSHPSFYVIFSHWAKTMASPLWR